MRAIGWSFLLVGLVGCSSGGSTPNTPPGLLFVAPSASAQLALGGSLTILYADSDPDSVATTSLFADIDGDLSTAGDQVLIAADRPDQDGATQTLQWDTTGVPAGVYRILAVTTDGVSTIVTDAGVQITVGSGNAAPTLGVSGPAVATAVCAGIPVRVEYTDDDPDDAASTSIFADVDGDLGTVGDQIEIAANRPDANGAQQSVVWNTVGVAPGTYFIVVRTDDGINPAVTATAAGTIRFGDAAALVFARSAGGALDESARVATYADGSFVVTGAFGSGGTNGSITLGAGEANETTLTTQGNFDFFVARYDADGRLLWARGGGNEQGERKLGQGVAAFADGSCVVSGSFRGSAFGLDSDDDSDDMFVARYDSDGNRLWARRAGGPQQDDGFSVTGFADGSFVVTGILGGTGVYGPGEANQTTVTVGTPWDTIIARYNADGTLAWVASEASSASDLGYDVATFPDGSCVIVSIRGAVPPFGLGDFHVSRYNADGTQAWTRDTGAANAVGSYRIAGFGDGSFVVAGHFGFYEPTTTFGPGDPNETTITAVDSDDVFLARYHADGTLNWVRTGGSDGTERAWGVAALPDGSCVFTGSFEQTVDFSGATLTSAGATDLFIAHYTAEGQLACLRRDGGGGAESGTVATFADGSILVAGVFVDPATFGAGELNETTLTGAGQNDLFLARYSPAGG